MITDGVVRSTCGICPSNCGVLVHLAGGKVIKIEGDPQRPANEGELCSKGLASAELIYHPDRLRSPLKRIGERGKGKWQQISWGEALDIVAGELTKARDNYGAESVAFFKGAFKGLVDRCLRRFANVFGSPNITYVGHVCMVPRRLGSIITCGSTTVPDYAVPPNCIILWGVNLSETRFSEYLPTMKALDKGAKLVVIDPRNMELASKADLWLQVRPGSDLALALGMINVIVNGGLFDKNFVDTWTVGFDELKAHVQDYPPEEVEEITWIEAKKIREVARFYATNKPAYILIGNSVEHNLNSFQAIRAISILKAITGNLNVPGGDVHWSLPELFALGELTLEDKMPADKRGKRVDAGLKLMPMIPEVHPQSVIKAIIEENPYPIRAAYVQGVNPLLVYNNSHRVNKAFQKLDFLAVAEMFMTPTAALADVVLPVASYLEFDSVIMSPYFPGIQVQQRVIEVPDCWPDYKILTELAKRLGLGQYFWDNEEQFLNDVLKPAGLTIEEFRKVGLIMGTKEYRKYEITGFETPSGKVELYSHRLKEWGFDPLPIYYELPETPYSDPDLAKEYPLIFTSWKTAAFRHSQGRQISSLRGTRPDPVIYIHPETAEKLDICEGDWVYIETKRGRLEQRATLTTSLDPRVVGVDWAWWFPEKGPSGSYGWTESNINILTDGEPPYNREMGSPNLRGIFCKVYKVPNQPLKKAARS